MKPLPENLMERHAVFIEALCADWREAGTATRVTPRADRVMEISRQMEGSVLPNKRADVKE